MTTTHQTAVITGASSGIGAATAKAFAAQGIHVILLARNQTALQEVANHIRASGGTAHVYPCDVTSIEQVRTTTAAILERHGVPDILFNNAGVGRWLSVPETQLEDVATMMAAPYFAAFYLTRQFLPGMLERNRGLILNITSPVGFFPVGGAAAYAAARWAVRGFHESLWAELRGTGVKATLVLPPKVSSSYFQNNPGSEERIPAAGRWMGTLSPEQVAARIVRSLRRPPKLLAMPVMVRAFLLTQRAMPGFANWLSAGTGWSHKARQKLREKSSASLS